MQRISENGIIESKVLLSIPHSHLLLQIVKNGPVTFASLTVATECCNAESLPKETIAVCYNCNRPALLNGAPIPTDNFLILTQDYGGAIRHVLINEKFDVFAHFFLGLERVESLVLASNLQMVIGKHLNEKMV